MSALGWLEIGLSAPVVIGITVLCGCTAVRVLLEDRRRRAARADGARADDGAQMTVPLADDGERAADGAPGAGR